MRRLFHRGLPDRIALGLLAILSGTLSTAWAQGEPLPDPLTLDMALNLADEPDPQLQQVQAELEMARAGLLEAEARDGVSVWIEGRARWIDPPEYSIDQSNEDHKLSIFARKNLYDFGRSSGQQAAATAELASRQQHYLAAREQRRIEVMRRYFDVLVADLAFARADEAMAVAYVTLDRLRNRRELGQVSELEILAMENEYQQVRHQRSVSEGRMRATRAQLAIALNRPGQLPANLTRPELPQLKRAIPDFQPLLDKALADNPRLQAVRQQVVATQQQLEAAYAGKRPRLSAEVEASEYSRKLGSNDSLRAGLYLEVPLYDGGTTNSLVARHQGALFKAQAQLAAAESELRQAVLDQWLALHNLRIEREQAASQRTYRELYLDRSRSLYEMEVKADLGDAMVRLTEAQLAEAEVQFALALAWERMDALSGGMLPFNNEQSAGEPTQ